MSILSSEDGDIHQPQSSLLPSGKRLQFAIEQLNMAIEIVDLPIKSSDFP